MNKKFDILVVGAGRGGTSLIASLLDYHPEIEIGMELFSVDFLMGKNLEYHGKNIFHERVLKFIEACDAEAINSPSNRWGNKITTEQIAKLEDHNIENPNNTIDILDQLFNHYFLDKKVIFILRDGRSCATSKVKRTGQPMKQACEKWLYSVVCYRFFKNKHSNNICIRFEDLLLNPEKNLLEISTFLNIEYDKEMLNGVENKKMWPEYKNNHFVISKAIPPKIEPQYFSQIEDGLSYCNYKLDY